MARSGTTNLNLGQYDEGESPGAGPKNTSNDGRNGDQVKVDVAVGTDHNANGTHKANIIDKANLKTTVADGSTIELDATVGLRVKALGIAGTKLNQTAGQVVDGTTLEFASDAIRIKDDGVTPAKISHDNNRTKFAMPFHLSTLAGTPYWTIGGVIGTATLQLRMRRAGCITGVQYCSSAGGTSGASAVYDTGASNHFAANAAIVVQYGGGQFDVYIAGVATALTVLNPGGIWTAPILGAIEFEFDD